LIISVKEVWRYEEMTLNGEMKVGVTSGMVAVEIYETGSENPVV